MGSKNDELLEAVTRQYARGVERLLDAGADPNARYDTGQSVLQRATVLGHIPTISLLLDRGVDVSAKDNGGRTALHDAARWNRIAEAKLLLAAGADVNSQDRSGWTPLHAAVAANSREIARCLMDAGADKQATTDQGLTPLRVASANEAFETGTVLGAKAQVQRNPARTTAIPANAVEFSERVRPKGLADGDNKVQSSKHAAQSR